MTKVLVIDDSAFMRQHLRGFLEDAGLVVEDFLPHSCQELILKVQSTKPDLVLSDFNMPDIDGLQVARTVRRVDADIPVVILTANHDTARDSLLGTLGVRQVLHKPIDGEKLVAVLRELLL
jgi:CheY-like chemotaxis protein